MIERTAGKSSSRQAQQRPADLPPLPLGEGSATRAVRVCTGSRLHFGMFSFGQPNVRQFGGVGAMLDRPGIELHIAPAERFKVDGPLTERARAFALRTFHELQLDEPPSCRLTVLSAPPEHVGLGTGTQLGLAVAAAINAFVENPPLGPQELARLSGRGKRSAIGTHGFAGGGLIVEAGKLTSDEISPLIARADLPARWRFVLVRSLNENGLSGEAERDAFVTLPPVPIEATQALCYEA